MKTQDNNVLTVRSLENYKSDVKIILEIDTLAWRRRSRGEISPKH